MITFLSQRWILWGSFAAVLFPMRSVSGVLDLSFLNDLEPLEFHLPTVTDPNVTENIVGYNPWMPRYQGSADPSKPTIVLMTGGCLPVEEGGSDFYQDARRGFYDECAKFGDVQCQCRPIIDPSKWQPKDILGLTDETIFNGIVECKWEIRRLLDEHKKGLINVAGISAKCSFDQPELFDELREHNIPIFLMGVNQPFPDEPEYNVPQPTGFLGTDQAFLGKTLARLLVQLRPEGGRFATMLNWGSTGMVRRRYGFLLKRFTRMRIRAINQDGVKLRSILSIQVFAGLGIVLTWNVCWNASEIRRTARNLMPSFSSFSRPFAKTILRTG